MAEDKVSAKILADAKNRVARINVEYREKIKKFESALEEQKKAYREETKRMAASEQERIRRELLSEARLEARREILDAKHQLIVRVIDTAAERFTSSKNYPALIAKTVAASPKTSDVLLSADDLKRLKSHSWARKAKPAPIMGGVILRTPGRDLNFSLDASFETLKESLTLEIARILFDETAPGDKGKAGSKK